MGNWQVFNLGLLDWIGVLRLFNSIFVISSRPKKWGRIQCDTGMCHLVLLRAL
jgi:hypothetical protein